MAVFTSEHTASKPYWCSDCDAPIKPGQKYARVAITPRDPDIGDANGKRWGTIRTHVKPSECEQT